MIGIRQPTPASCGQTCIAMIIGRPVSDVFAVLPDRARGTRTAELVEALRHFGRSCAGELRRIKRGSALPPSLVIVKVLWPGRAMGHWMVANHGRILDPDGPRLRWRAAGGHITSYLEVFRA